VFTSRLATQMILSDHDLKLLLCSNRLVVNPLASNAIQQNGIDLRIAKQMARRVNAVEIINGLSKEDISNSFEIINSLDDSFVVSPLSHLLFSTQEKIKMPNDIVGFCGLRSTFARLGFVSPLTVVDAGFEGTLTIGVFYGGSAPIKVPVGCRFLHVIFAELKSEVEVPYQGHYQGQSGISIPKSLL
jgi:dCTP deaminase